MSNNGAAEKQSEDWRLLEKAFGTEPDLVGLPDGSPSIVIYRIGCQHQSFLLMLEPNTSGGRPKVTLLGYKRGVRAMQAVLITRLPNLNLEEVLYAAERAVNNDIVVDARRILQARRLSELVLW